jgi:hypothetical protein
MGDRLMEPLSILNPPIIDILNDPRVTSESLIKEITKEEVAITKQVAEMASKVKREDLKAMDAMMFALLQHHLHVTNLHTKLTAWSKDLMYKTVQLNLRLERLTKWLIGLTIALSLFAIPLAIDVILKWLKK